MTTAPPIPAEDAIVPPAAVPQVHDERPMFAIALRLLAALLISVMFIAVKLAANRGVHTVEALFYRQFIACPVVLAWSAWTTGLGALRTRRIGLHLSRAVIGVTGMACNFSSFILLQVTQATAIGFMVPIIGTILSALLLKEKTGMHRWAAVVAGFAGVLVIVQPGGQAMPPLLGLTVAILAAVVTAVISILLRSLGRTEGASTTVFWFTALSIPPLGLIMLPFAQGHDATTWMILIIIGVSGGLAQLCMTGALKFAPVSVVLPMDYSSLIWMTLLGWELFGEWPGHATWIGAMLIIGSGLYIAWREHVRNRVSVG